MNAIGYLHSTSGGRAAWWTGCVGWPRRRPGLARRYRSRPTAAVHKACTRRGLARLPSERARTPNMCNWPLALHAAVGVLERVDVEQEPARSCTAGEVGVQTVRLV